MINPLEDVIAKKDEHIRQQASIFLLRAVCNLMNCKIVFFTAFLATYTSMYSQQQPQIFSAVWKVDSTIHFKQFDLSGKSSVVKQDNGIWQCETRSNNSKKGKQTQVYFSLKEGYANNAGVSVHFVFKKWSVNNYVIIPGAVYSGNRFDVKKYKYAPLFQKADYRTDMPITITDVPRLNKYDGLSQIDLNTGDMTTPGVGIYFPSTQSGLWILTGQGSEKGNNMISLRENANRTEAEIIIAAPCVRDQVYRMCGLVSSTEKGTEWKAGDEVDISYKIFSFSNIHSPAELNDKFLDVRKSFGTTDYVNQIPFSEAFKTMENQQNSQLWSETDSIYCLTQSEGWNMKFQLGWVGGCIVTHPLSLIGKNVSKERSFKNWDHVMLSAQSASGFFYSCSNGKAWCSDCFNQPHPDNLLLLRKNADAFYYLYKYCEAMKLLDPQWQVPQRWREPMRKWADAFLSLWKREGQLGQFIDIETGAIRVGGTNSSASVIAGFALASCFEKRKELLDCACVMGEYYYRHFIQQGISCGGPSEILQNPDSESSFATLEAFVVLYEYTKDKKWLRYAEDAAALCSTWMVSYDYNFPPTSLFGKNDMRTSGAVWASTQNKHGVPGICTFSGDCLLKLYRATGNKNYLMLLRDLAHNIMQYMSRNDRPLAALQQGWVNERVNLSDWEGVDQIGDIFNGNTWAQVSAMLTVAEVPGIYVNIAQNQCVVFDHVEAVFKGNSIIITNPTNFDASVRIFIDRDVSNPYPEGYVSQLPCVTVKAGESIEFTIEQTKGAKNKQSK